MAKKSVDDLMRERFEELLAKRNTILAKAGPLREQRDADFNAAQELRRKRDVEIKEVEADLYETQNDLGKLARALGGKYMSQVS